MCLAEDDRDSKVPDLPAGLEIKKVIGDYLRFLKEAALEKLCEQWGTGKVTAKDVVWALTVPAAWSESAKQTMRQACCWSWDGH